VRRGSSRRAGRRGNSRAQLKRAHGKRCPAPIIALPNAAPKLSAPPITSPVDFISGPRIVSTPGNRTHQMNAATKPDQAASYHQDERCLVE